MKVLLVGGGSIGTRRLRNLRRLEAGLLALVEPNDARRIALTNECRLLGFRSLAEGLAWRPDCAVIATPTNLHMPQALQAARAGCHLFIEKPLSHNREGIADLQREVQARALVTMVACNMRYHPGPATVKRLLDEGAIGRILTARLHTGSYLPRWRPDQDYRQSYSASPEHGGATLDCIHEIDLALWCFGPARFLAAATLPATTLGLETDGLAEILLRHDSGVLASVHLNFLQRDTCRCVQIIGTDGTIRWDCSAECVEVFGGDGRLARVIAQPDHWQLNQMYLDELSGFLDAVRQRRPSVNPLSGGLAALEIALAAREQARA
jgi:predicted dehydrogenase